MSFRSSSLPSLAALALVAGSFTFTSALAVVPDSASATNADAKGLALQGYDAVSYFTDGAPQKGNPKFHLKHDGVTYYFVSAAHLRQFKANPAAYLPQFGGFCAMGTANGYKLDGDPQVWRIVDAKLYLNNNPAVGKRWSQDIPGNISRADGNWPQIKDKTPNELK